jgi:hypothetical protein
MPGRSFATELVKVDAGTCPLRSESDRQTRHRTATLAPALVAGDMQHLELAC